MKTRKTTKTPVSKEVGEESADPQRCDIEVKRVLHRGEIKFMMLRYYSPKLAASLSGPGLSVPVKVRIDSRDIGKIYVLNERANRVIAVAALAQGYAHGLSLHQHKANLTSNRKMGSKVDVEAIKTRIKAGIEKIIKDGFRSSGGRERKHTRINSADQGVHSLLGDEGFLDGIIDTGREIKPLLE